MLEISQTKLEGVVLLTPKRHGDARGIFCETWNKARKAETGLDFDFVQDNQSLSSDFSMHYQSPPHARAKLVRCGREALLDVAVDIHKGSLTYGPWISQVLSAENGRQLLITESFLHGFITLLPDTEILNKCNDYYSPECDGAIRFDDPDIGVDCSRATSEAILSGKDEAAQSFADFDPPFDWKPS